jgi:hypothetical protein
MSAVTGFLFAGVRTSFAANLVKAVLNLRSEIWIAAYSMQQTTKTSPKWVSFDRIRLANITNET